MQNTECTLKNQWFYILSNMHVSIYVQELCILFISVAMVTPIQGHPPTAAQDNEVVLNTGAEMKVSLVHGTNVAEKNVRATDFGSYMEGNVTDDPWKLVTDSPPVDPRFWPTVGNGHVATVVYSDTVFMNGLYNGNGTESMRARIPAMTAVNIQSISPNGTARLFVLDMKKGIFIQQYTDVNWTVQLKTYAHRTKTRLLVTTVTIETTDALATDLVVHLNVNHGDLQSDAIDLTNGTSNVTDARYICGRQKIPETPTSERVPVHMYYSNVPDHLTIAAHSPAHTYEYLYLASISPFEEEARDYFLQGVDAFQSGTLEQTHVDGWREVWDSGCIDIEGNTTLASSVYSALYYILSAMPTVEETSWPFIGLSPEDLAHGNIEHIQYGGHVFWDQETWMYPTILALHSKLGKTLVGTRIRTLDSAYLYATQRDYKGAMYPWESAFVGLNVSPGGRWAKYEMHITGDIALAFKQYLMMTCDTDMLNKGRLAEAILGIAEFWLSRSTFNKSRGTFDILDVMPPDEWNYPVNNSAYTNAIAQISLLLPKYAEGLVGRTAPDRYELVADLMYMPNDKVNNYHPEFDGFTLNHTVKQADVVLMGYPLMVQMTEEERRNDLEIYERLTAEGPAMTWGMFAVGWLEVGDPGKARELFYRQLRNKREPFNVWTELTDGSGATNFITGMGGYLQSILFGYGGLRMYTDRIDFNCTPIPDTTGFTIRGLDYLGSSLNICCKDESISVTLIKEGPVKLHLYLYESSKSVNLPLQHTLTLPRQKVSVRSGASGLGHITTLLMSLALLCSKIILFLCLL